MSLITHSVGSAVERVDVSAYQIPTATDQESDGTLAWDSTAVVVVEVHADGHTGLGYTYGHPAAAQVIESKLTSVIEGADAMMPERCWAQMEVQSRQLGHAGIAAMAISAVDVALWDLKARLLGVCLADALPRFHEHVPIYGSGGFCNYSSELLRADARRGRGAHSPGRRHALRRHHQHAAYRRHVQAVRGGARSEQAERYQVASGGGD